MTNRIMIADYIIGMWISDAGNILQTSIDDDGKLELSFGTEINDSEYEFITDSYKYSITKNWFKQEYDIRLQDGITIHAIPGNKILKVYKKNKLLGSFGSIGTQTGAHAVDGRETARHAVDD